MRNLLMLALNTTSSNTEIVILNLDEWIEIIFFFGTLTTSFFVLFFYYLNVKISKELIVKYKTSHLEIIFGSIAWGGGVTFVFSLIWRNVVEKGQIEIGMTLFFFYSLYTYLMIRSKILFQIKQNALEQTARENYVVRETNLKFIKTETVEENPVEEQKKFPTGLMYSEMMEDLRKGLEDNGVKAVPMKNNVREEDENTINVTFIRKPTDNAHE